MKWEHEITKIGDTWTCGLWLIFVNGTNKNFVVVDTDGARNFPSFPEAEKWCAEQDRLAAEQAEPASIPLPKPGDVWGVPEKPETRRFVVNNGIATQVRYVSQEAWPIVPWMSMDGWREWARETGAINLLEDAAWVVEAGKAAGWDGQLPLPEFIARLSDELKTAVGDNKLLREELAETKAEAEKLAAKC